MICCDHLVKFEKQGKFYKCCKSPEKFKNLVFDKKAMKLRFAISTRRGEMLLIGNRDKIKLWDKERKRLRDIRNR